MAAPRTLFLMESVYKNDDAKWRALRKTYTPLLDQKDERKSRWWGFTRRRKLMSGLLEDEEDSGCLSGFVIFPGTLTGWWWLEVWDLFVLTMILLLCYFEPYTFALYKIGDEPVSLVLVNKLLNITFTADMVLEFFIAWPRSEDSLHKDLWESNPSVLMRHYLGFPVPGRSRGGWFWFDLMSVLPCWVASFTASDNMANPLLMLRILRIFQSPRLHRLSKLQEFVHSKTGYHMILYEVLKFFVITTLTCHWMACLWVMVEGKICHGLISYYTEGETWLTVLIDTKGDICEPSASEDPACTYLLAYYWATMTLTSVGYGDISPQNKLEYALSILCMAVVGYIWAYIVGSIVSILSNLDPESGEFKHTLDQLNSLMHRRALPTDLQMRLRHYMHETRHFGIMKEQRELVEKCMSNGLQRELASRSTEVSCILKGVFWMRELEDEAVLDIVRAMYPLAFGPCELISIRDSMLTVQKGIAGVKGRVLARGDVWGHHDILLESPQLLDCAMPRTVSYVEVLRLDRRSLLEVCRAYPSADRRLRKAQIRTAVARSFCRAAQKVQQRRTSKPRRPSAHQEAVTSFVNPGMKPGLLRWDGSAFADSSSGLLELKKLLVTALQNQTDMEERLETLHEEVRRIQGKVLAQASLDRGARGSQPSSPDYKRVSSIKFAPVSSLPDPELDPPAAAS